jgi:hypothetical protein
MGKFGWSYPPGCTGTPYDEDIWCEVCGGNPDIEPDKEGGCICPECPVCGEAGNPDCYADGHLQMTQAQAEQKVKFEIAMAEEDNYDIVPIEDITNEDILC